MAKGVLCVTLLGSASSFAALVQMCHSHANVILPHCRAPQSVIWLHWLAMFIHFDIKDVHSGNGLCAKAFHLFLIDDSACVEELDVVVFLFM